MISSVPKCETFCSFLMQSHHPEREQVLVSSRHHWTLIVAIRVFGRFLIVHRVITRVGRRVHSLLKLFVLDRQGVVGPSIRGKGRKLEVRKRKRRARTRSAGYFLSWATSCFIFSMNVLHC